VSLPALPVPAPRVASGPAPAAPVVVLAPGVSVEPAPPGAEPVAVVPALPEVVPAVAPVAVVVVLAEVVPAVEPVAVLLPLGAEPVVLLLPEAPPAGLP
jgi:hypothetical protein